MVMPTRRLLACALQTLAAVQRAVLESPLGLTPRAEGQEVLVPVPR